MLDTIKSYLVSLGFSVDRSSFNDVTSAIDSVERSVGKFAGTSVTKFAIAGAAVTSFVAASVFGLAKFVDSLGKADIQNEMLARQMWTTEQNAMSFNATLKSMGVSLQDLYVSPTLMSQFKQLRQDAAGLQAPSEYKDQMRTIQSISFEFKRMKLEATYALQWIGYYFIKYMSGPLKDIKKTLGGINDTIIKTMPTWTKNIAQVMSLFALMGIAAVRGFRDILHVFDDLGQGIPKNLKLVAGAAATIGIIIATGPFGIIAAIILGVILLLDDFYGYLDGKESAFGPLWQNLIDLKDELDASGQLKALKENLGSVMESASEVLDVLGEIVATLFGVEDSGEGLRKLASFITGTLNLALQATKGLLDSIADSLRFIDSLLSGTTGQFLADRGDVAKEKLIAEGVDVESHGMLKDAKRFGRELFSADMFKWDGTMSKRIDIAFGNLGKIFSPNQKPKDYIYPSSDTKTSKTDMTLNQTNNIYGSDPNATAGAVVDNTDMMMRGMRGVIR